MSFARCSTPKRCCSSTTTSPRRPKERSSSRRACVPTGDRPPRRRHRAPARPSALASGRRVRSSIPHGGRGGGPRVARVLLGQDLGRRHERGLVARADGQHHGREGDRRLAAPDVALEEAVHRLRPRHVVRDLPEGAPLRAGEGEREERRHLCQPGGPGLEDDARVAPHPAPPERQGQLKEEELLEDEAPERRDGPVGGLRRVGSLGREVSLAQGVGYPQELAARADGRRQVVHRERRQLVAQPLHELAQRRVLVVRGPGVDRDHAPEAGRVTGGELLHLGLAHLAATAEPLRHLARDEQRLACRELLQAPGRGVEEDEVEPPARVGDLHLEERLAALHAGQLGAAHGRHGDADLGGPQLRDGAGAGAILVGLGPEGERLLHRQVAALLQERAGRRVNPGARRASDGGGRGAPFARQRSPAGAVACHRLTAPSPGLLPGGGT